jgi:hypothetical protein
MHLSIPPRLVILTLAFHLLVVTFAAHADDIQWRLHTIDAENINSSGAMIDVNRDGKLDIIAGQFWYEAPTWKRHFAREVEVIRGRNDDYSCLPIDLNGDGWTDLVSVNYRSASLYWVEHPGKSLVGPWTKHIIDSPGPSETGILADVDGDGQMDILPNGTKFAAWYSWARERDGDGMKVIWERHELPNELAGHGIGFGDLNGDGRGDIIGAKGWAEAPKNARTGRWIWHDEPKPDADASIPILVHDVDADGDADLIWGRGHNFGLSWQENQASGERKLAESASPTWKHHTIDETWSQAHAIILADINGDGRQDLVAGKRYFGHDGKDPGAKMPMVINWYSFSKKTGKFERHAIHESEKVAFGLDPKAADIDGDGDIDLLCPDRAGLYLLENLRNRP